MKTRTRPDIIDSRQRLALTLRYLATGASFRQCIRETCQLIYDRLQPEYLAMPNTADDWKKISNDFWRRWNIPNCVGSIDGKHCVLRKPRKSG